MHWIRFLVVAALAVLAQTTLMRLFPVPPKCPDLLVAMLVTFSLGATPAEGFAVGAILGLGRDLFTEEPFGLSTGLFAVLGYAVAWRRPSVLVESFLTRALFAFLCSIASSLVSVLVLVAQRDAPGLRTVAEGTALAAASAAAAAAVVGAAVWRRARWFGLRRRSEFEHV